MRYPWGADRDDAELLRPSRCPGWSAADVLLHLAQTNGADLSTALLKLYKDNASTLTPDPVYVKFYYSHPPATERLARMPSSAQP